MEPGNIGAEMEITGQQIADWQTKRRNHRTSKVTQSMFGDAKWHFKRLLVLTAHQVNRRRTVTMSAPGQTSSVPTSIATKAPPCEYICAGELDGLTPASRCLVTARRSWREEHL